MNREYLGPTIGKVTFLCKIFKVGDFVIGKDVTEEVDAYLREYKMPTISARVFDPYNTISKECIGTTH